MTVVTRVKFSDGSTALVEAVARSSRFEISRGRKELASAQASAGGIDELIECEIRRYSMALAGSFDQIRDTVNPPRRAEIKFGLRCEIDGNLVLAAVSEQANIQVTLEWDLENS